MHSVVGEGEKGWMSGRCGLRRGVVLRVVDRENFGVRGDFGEVGRRS